MRCPRCQHETGKGRVIVKRVAAHSHAPAQAVGMWAGPAPPTAITAASP